MSYDEGYSKYITEYARMACYCLVSVLPFSPPDQRLWMSLGALVFATILIVIEKPIKRKIISLILLGGLVASITIVFLTSIFIIQIIVYLIGAIVAYNLFKVESSKKGL